MAYDQDTGLFCDDVFFDRDTVLGKLASCREYARTLRSFIEENKRMLVKFEARIKQLEKQFRYETGRRDPRGRKPNMLENDAENASPEGWAKLPQEVN